METPFGGPKVIQNEPQSKMLTESENRALLQREPSRSMAGGSGNDDFDDLLHDCRSLASQSDPEESLEGVQLARGGPEGQGTGGGGPLGRSAVPTSLGFPP